MHRKHLQLTDLPFEWAVSIDFSFTKAWNDDEYVEVQKIFFLELKLHLCLRCSPAPCFPHQHDFQMPPQLNPLFFLDQNTGGQSHTTDWHFSFLIWGWVFKRIYLSHVVLIKLEASSYKASGSTSGMFPGGTKPWPFNSESSVSLLGGLQEVNLKQDSYMYKWGRHRERRKKSPRRWKVES